jgi:predicted alpha-1,2-mannosidase
MRRATSVLVLLATACASHDAAPTPPAPDAAPFDPTPYVDPFIGTGGHGHTFPGATVPFGMVQLSPDTRLTGWDGCSGYHHDDEWIYGFSHTHLSGTGCSDYGDILLMPGVGDVAWNNGADGKPGYRQHFSHANETASAGAYSVLLDSGVKCEMTATTRVGIHRYTFPAGTGRASVLIDLDHRDQVLETSIEVVGDREVRGYRRSRAWAQDQRVYFVARFSKPFGTATVWRHGDLVRRFEGPADDARKLSLLFGSSESEPLVVKVGISAVDCDGAARNLDAEMPGFEFDAARSAALSNWRSQLGKIEVHGGADAQLRTFYTALYHCCIAPNVFGDVDGRYRGRDGKVHQENGWTQYTVFSLWDTFRALHPLMTILEPDRTRDWISTFIAQYREGGALPVWELAGNETDCMIGYHAVPVIADAYIKGIRGYDANAALDAMVASANRDVRGLEAYREMGFVPADQEGESVSKTLEYAYDDWCIAEMAREMGKHDVARAFDERAQFWKNMFDPASGFFRPRRNNTWIEPFDPAEVNNHLTEANSWQYSLFVPHDVDGLAALLGGRAKLAARLDALFSAQSATKGRDQADITGMIGQYAHGNEPSHHMAWLYDFTDCPSQSQERVRQILDTLYSDRPDGLCGNEDCGQMSAWYVFSAMGLYPVCPGRPEYDVGTPLFDDVTIRAGDRAFRIQAHGTGPYVRSATLERREVRAPLIAHSEIVGGGTLTVERAGEPTSWGAGGRPPVPRPKLPIVPVPFVVGARRVFPGMQEITLGSVERFVMYSVDGGKTFEHYEHPFTIDATTEVVMYGPVTGGPPRSVESKRVTARFVKSGTAWKLTLAHSYAEQYAADGPNTLIDGERGGGDWRTGGWQGFQGEDVDATIDLGVERDVKTVRIGFFRDVGSWIWFPAEVVFSVSTDGKEFRELGRMPTKVDERETALSALVYQFTANTRARYVRVVGKNRGTCPAWHPGAGHKAWLFADEIGIEFAE